MQQLGTKAETLKILYNQLKHVEVLLQYSFTSKYWQQNRFKETEGITEN